MSAKNKRIYAAVLAVALLGLLVNALLPAGSGAEPASALAAPRHDRGATAAPADAPTLMVVAAPFPRDLPAAEGAPVARDIFALSAPAARALFGVAAADGAEPGGRRVGARPRAAEFRAAHRLSAVLSDGEVQIAIVDGRWVREGEKIDGCPLTRIVGQSAYFACGDAEADISVYRAQP